MGATFSRIKTWIAGETLTASDLNAEYDNILNNFDPDGMDDASANNAAMDATADPYPGASQSLATDLRGELQRVRFILAQITGEADWYIDPDTDLATHFAATAIHGATGAVVGTTNTQTLTNKTLTTPTVADLINMTHDHSNAAGGGVLALDLQTETATTSGTEHDYTGIASTIKRITIMFAGVSTDGTSIPIIQLGDSGGFEATGYLGSGSNMTTDTNAGSTANNTGFLTGSSHAAASLLHGKVELVLQDSANNVWAIGGTLSTSDTAGSKLVSGTKALSATLTQIRLTTVNGTDAFDAGAINIMLE